MKDSIKCKTCKTVIKFNEHGNLTKCEHHPFTELEKTTTRHSFQYILCEFGRAENPVTQWALREILINRLEVKDLS